MDLEKIHKLIMSSNFEDKLIGLSLLDKVSSMEFEEFMDNYMKPGTSEWTNSDWVIAFNKNSKLPEGYLEDSYIEGNHGYYYLTGHGLCIDGIKNYLYWTTERNFKLRESWKS